MSAEFKRFPKTVRPAPHSPAQTSPVAPNKPDFRLQAESPGVVRMDLVHPEWGTLLFRFICRGKTVHIEIAGRDPRLRLALMPLLRRFPVRFVQPDAPGRHAHR